MDHGHPDFLQVQHPNMEMLACHQFATYSSFGQTPGLGPRPSRIRLLKFLQLPPEKYTLISTRPWFAGSSSKTWKTSKQPTKQTNKQANKQTNQRKQTNKQTNILWKNRTKSHVFSPVKQPFDPIQVKQEQDTQPLRCGRRVRDSYGFVAAHSVAPSRLRLGC